MKKWLIILGLLLVVGFGAFAFFSTSRTINVLVFSKTEQFRHESIEKGIATIRELGEQHGFSVEATEDAAVFKEKKLKNFNVIIFLNTTGDILNEAQQTEMQRFIQAGGGFVGVHAAADTEYDWPWYGELVGAYFRSHPNDPNVRDASINVVHKDHEATEYLPDVWPRTDEWYNYKDVKSAIKVLLELDESTYDGGTHSPDPHPISWYREFDGGRTFYTGLGHTDETYDEELFRQHLWGGISYVAGEGVAVDYNQATVTPEENRFQKVVLDQNLYEPMELEILPNRDILFIERHGTVKRYDAASDSTYVINEIPVFDGLEDGLLGMALDPNFEANQWVYLYYSPKGAEPIQHLSRFDYTNDRLDLTSEKVMLKVPVQREECCHSAGSIEFGPQGNLFLSLGDNTSPRATGFAPIDEQAGRSPWDAQKSSSNTNDLRGKILRIHPEDDGTYTIPDGNLFPKDGSEGRPEIYVMGCRNPYRIHIDPHTGYLYWGDVGPDAGEPEEEFGPAGHDEINQARASGNFGWPYFVGDNQAYREYDFERSLSLAAFDPLKPINNSPNNTGARELPPAQAAYIWYPYAKSEEFPALGEGGRNAMAGPVYHFGDFPETDKRFPEYYDGKFFAYDWMRGWIMAVTMDEKGDLVRMERFLPSMTFNNPIDIVMGPDGDMFMLEYGTNWFAQNEDARLVHLQYIAGNRQPLADFTVDKQVGAAPLTVQFDGTPSKDFDGDDLSYSWKFGPTDASEATAKTSHTFEQPGVYEVSLTVKDEAGKADVRTLEILVGNEMPEVSWSLSGNQTFYFDNQTLGYAVKVEDAEDGQLGAGIDEQAVAMSIDYLERGYDLTHIAQGHEAMAEASAYFVGQQLIENSDCRACHQMEQASVGPTYQAIAEKYELNQENIRSLAQKIIKGGNGAWGEAVMSAHPQLSEGEAEKMSQYILSLDEAGQSMARLPLKGNFKLDQHLEKGTAGVYVFSASYTDQGGKGARELTAREVMQLRHPQLEAENFDFTQDSRPFDVTPDMIPGLEQAFTIMMGGNGQHFGFAQLDLTGISGIEVAASALKPFMEGGYMEVRLDAPDGEVIASQFIEAKLNFSSFPPPIKINFPPQQGKHDVYFSFRTENGQDGLVCSVDWVEFLSGGAL